MGIIQIWGFQLHCVCVQMRDPSMIGVSRFTPQGAPSLKRRRPYLHSSWQVFVLFNFLAGCRNQNRGFPPPPPSCRSLAPRRPRRPRRAVGTGTAGTMAVASARKWRPKKPRAFEPPPVPCGHCMLHLRMAVTKTGIEACGEKSSSPFSCRPD